MAHIQPFGVASEAPEVGSGWQRSQNVAERDVWAERSRAQG